MLSPNKNEIQGHRPNIIYASRPTINMVLLACNWTLVGSSLGSEQMDLKWLFSLFSMTY